MVQSRTGKKRDLYARNVIVATGGFDSNPATVLRNWPSGEPRPQRLLLGAAHSADGYGHDMVSRAGGSIERLDPRDATGTRGLAAFNLNGIWINQEGKRFTQEFGDPKTGPAWLLRQPGDSYWTVFDQNGRNGFSIPLAGWDNFRDVSKVV